MTTPTQFLTLLASTVSVVTILSNITTKYFKYSCVRNSTFGGNRDNRDKQTAQDLNLNNAGVRQYYKDLHRYQDFMLQQIVFV